MDVYAKRRLVDVVLRITDDNGRPIGEVGSSVQRLASEKQSAARLSLAVLLDEIAAFNIQCPADLRLSALQIFYMDRVAVEVRAKGRRTTSDTGDWSTPTPPKFTRVDDGSIELAPEESARSHVTVAISEDRQGQPVMLMRWDLRTYGERTLDDVNFVWRTLRELADSGDPTPRHYGIVRRALKQQVEEDDDEIARDAIDAGEARDIMGRALLRALSKMRVAIGMDEPAPTSAAEAAIAEQTPEGPALRWNERLATWLEARFGEAGAEPAVVLRREAHEDLCTYTRAVEAGVSPEAHARALGVLWQAWLPTDGSDGAPRDSWVIRIIAHLLWTCEIKTTVSHAAPIFSISTVPGNITFAGLPKVAAGISWALGAPGDTIVDGDKYAHEPTIATNALSANALVPKSYGIEGLFPADYLDRPHTTLLPLEHDEHEAIFAVAMAEATQYAISPVAGKEALLLLASAVETGDQPQRIVIGDIAQRINPETKRLKKSHYINVARGFNQLRGLFVYFKDYRRVPCFDIWEAPWTPEHASKKMEIVARVHPALLHRVGAYDKVQNPFRGYFLINLSGAMALPTKKSGLLRLYVRTAAGWNSGWKPGTKGKPDPTQIPARTLTEWAALTNSMSPAAVEYLRSKGKSGRRQKISDARREIREWFDDLEGRNLVRLEKPGRDLVQPVWPKAYLHAWELARMKGLRREPGD